MPQTSQRESLSRLLIVEDNPSQLRTLTSIMQQEGFEVIGASTGAEALAHLEREDFGVAVVDLRLPDLPGTQLLEKINALDPRIRIIINTGYSSFDSAKEAVNLGAFAYVEKAGNPEELVRRVHDASRWHLERYATDLEDAVAARTSELHESNAALRSEITERKQVEHALRLIVEGTSWALGDEFFRSLTRHLALDLGVRLAFVSELQEGAEKRLRLLALWEGNGFSENFEYGVKGTPCERVIEEGLTYYPANVQRLFPEDHWLEELRIEGYLAVPLMDSEGNCLGHLGVADDKPIPESLPAESMLRIFAARAGAELLRKRSEKALRQSEARFRAIFEDAPVGISVTDSVSGRFVRINKKYGDICGYSQQEMLGMSFDEISHPDDLEADLSRMRNLLDGTIKNFELERRYLHKDGSIVWVSMTCVPLWKTEADPKLHVAIVEDITDRKRTEERLRKLSVAVEQSPAMVLITDTQGKIEYANPKFTEVTGYSLEEIMGKNPRILKSGEMTRENYRELWETITAGKE